MTEVIFSLLSEVSKTVNWTNFELLSDLDNEDANGFLSEFFLVSIRNPKNKEVLRLAAKKAFKNKDRRLEINIPVAYQNEIYFYDTLFPELNAFKDRKKVNDQFDFIPRMYACSKKKTDEILLLENLNTSGYQMMEKSLLLDKEHLTLIFITYGKFHGLAFSFKDQHPEKYCEIMNKISHFWLSMEERSSFNIVLHSAIIHAFEFVHREIKENCRHYLSEKNEEFWTSMVYQGKHSILNHGDCRSNNMMFRYKDSKLDSMKLIDFQMITDGTPVYDLSYFFYSGANIENIKKLDEYLKIYYNSLSVTVKSLGSNASKLLPFEVLKEDWKKYSKFGIQLAILVHKIKLLDNGDLSNVDMFKDMAALKLKGSNCEIFKERVKALIEDVYENGYL